MKKLLIFLIMFLTALNLIAAESVAIALQAKGDIDLMRGDKKSQVATGTSLMNKDELVSKDESFAVVKFIDGSSMVKVFPNSILTIAAQEENGELNKKNTLKTGTIWAKVSKKTGMFEIDTPNTVVSVKGTEFMVDVDENGFTSVLVKEGEVNVKNKDTDEEKGVSSGEKAVIDDSGSIGISRSAETNFEDPTRAGDGDDVLRIELKNDDGEIQIIEIEFEDKR